MFTNSRLLSDYANAHSVPLDIDDPTIGGNGASLGNPIAERSPEHIAWYAQVRSVPFKRFARKELSYLEKPKMVARLAAPDLHSRNGARDHALLFFLYNSGAPVTQGASLRVSDLSLRANQIGSVQLKGKGDKTRRCPLWPATCDELLAIIRNRPLDDPVFLNERGHSITRHGIYWMLRKYVRAIAQASSDAVR